jgi:hypothetical protein
MNVKELPPRPSLEQYKKQAKELVKSKRGSGDKFTLADAQFVIAREHGFESWPKFAKHIETLTRQSSPRLLWESAQKALIAGDVSTLDRLLRENEQLFHEQRPPSYGSGGLAPDYSGGDARSVMVRNHHFESWAGFAEYIEALRHNSSRVAQFEAAVDAVVSGDVATLERLLREKPELIRARSTRAHHSTLLHYVGSNGVEYFRQKTPKNIVKVAEILLEAGAEVDAAADMYGGGSTTLGLAATSIHPFAAGVLEPLIALLLEHGAAVDGPGGRSSVNACLANGRQRGAELMAGYGARLDLQGAAGVGRLDLVKSFFKPDGSLKTSAARAQMHNAFAWACQYGRTSVVDFLLQRGMQIDAKLPHNGQTGMHWAASNAHVDTVKLLLERQAPVDAKDETWGGTPLGWALHGWGEAWRHQPSGDTRERYYEVVALLVDAGAVVKPEWLVDENIRADPRMVAALRAD